MSVPPTIHNAARKGQIAETVLMPGDPKRAAYMADQFLDGAELVSEVRGIPVYTGRYQGCPVSVMASGMGAGSMGIYSYELYKYYGVARILRVGTAGGLSASLRLRDLVLGLSVSTDSGFASQFELPGIFSPCCSFPMACKAQKTGSEMGLRMHTGMIFSGAAFHYSDDYLRRWANAGALVVEMETSALYMNAQVLGREALTLCTVTDMVFREEHCSIEERQKGLDDMLELAFRISTE